METLGDRCIFSTITDDNEGTSGDREFSAKKSPPKVLKYALHPSPMT
jgi:hypothetical protein